LNHDTKINLATDKREKFSKLSAKNDNVSPAYNFRKDNHRYLMKFLNIHNYQNQIHRTHSASSPELNYHRENFILESPSNYLFPKSKGDSFKMKTNIKNIKQEQEKEVEICEIIPDYKLISR